MEGGFATSPRRVGSNGGGSGHASPGIELHKVEGWLAVLEVFLHVVIILFAAVELGPKFVPPPTLVWNDEVTEAPGFKTVSINLKNEASVPLEQLEANWTLANPAVKIYVQNTAPPNDVESPSASKRILHFTGPMAAGTNFAIYLHADEPFEIASQQFAALVPRISNFRTFTEPAEVESLVEWSAHRREFHLNLAYTIAILLALGFGIHKVVAKGRRAIESEEKK